MFKVPDWEDTPSNNLNINVLSKKNKQKSKKTRTTERKTKTAEQPTKQVVQAKPRFKAKTKSNSNIKIVNGVLKPNKTENTQQNEKKKLNKNGSNILIVNKKKSDDDITNKITNYDSDKLDELISDVKKQRLHNTHKNVDNKELLFRGSPEVAVNNIKKKSSNKPTNISVTKTIVKPKQKRILPIELNNKQIIIKDKPDKVDKTEKDVTDNAIDKKEIEKSVKLKNVRKKELLKSILQIGKSRNHINVSGNKLRERMLNRLKAAQFRYLNEKLYTSTGSDAQKLFQGDPSAFQTYHEGYQQQVKKWPVKPLDIIVKRIQKMPKTHMIADMGCGEADLSKRVTQTVRSFDLVASAPGVEACDMARTPLLAQSMDVAVYCLALMGTDLTKYLIEANRVLKPGGHLLIAEVESRFQDVNAFASDVQRLGFSLKKLDDSQQVFYFLEFNKTREPPAKKSKLPTLTLKPCIYKRR